MRACTSFLCRCDVVFGVFAPLEIDGFCRETFGSLKHLTSLKYYFLKLCKAIQRYRLWYYRVAKKPRVCGYHPWGRFAKWAVSEEGFMSTRYIMYPKHKHNKKNDRWWSIPENHAFWFIQKINHWFILKIHSDLQFRKPNFTTFWGRFANFENFARRKVGRFLQLCGIRGRKPGD